MGKNANFVSHKKSKLKNQDGSPQLPSASVLVEGEIAINFGKDVETLSIKNESGDVVTFSSDNYYTEKKLGSGFTKENSANTVTSVIETLVGSGFTSSSITDVIIENEEIVSAALTDLDNLVGSGFTSSSITDVIIENEEITSTALIDLNERKLDATAYTPTDLSNYYKRSETSGATEISNALSNYYTRSETSGKTEISNALGTKVNSATFTSHTADTTIHFTTGTVQTQIDNSISGKVNTSDIVSAITPSNSGSTNPIATKVVAENELTVSNALNDLDDRKLDASAYTPTDLTNYYTKSETSGATEISNALSNYYTKSQTSGATEISNALGGKANTSDLASYADSVKYNSTSHYVEFYHGTTAGTKVFEYDASPFIIDGMVQNVEIKDVTSGASTVTCLVISFNTDAGKQDINIPISDIFDANNYYTKSETSGATEVNTALSNKADKTAVDDLSGQSETIAAALNDLNGRVNEKASQDDLNTVLDDIELITKDVEDLTKTVVMDITTTDAKGYGESTPTLAQYTGNKSNLNGILSHFKLGWFDSGGTLVKECAPGRISAARDGSEIAIDGTNGDLMVYIDTDIYRDRATVSGLNVQDSTATTHNVIGLGLAPHQLGGKTAKKFEPFGFTPHCAKYSNSKGYSYYDGGNVQCSINSLTSSVNALNKGGGYMGLYYEFYEIWLIAMYMELGTLDYTNDAYFGNGCTNYTPTASNWLKGGSGCMYTGNTYGSFWTNTVSSYNFAEMLEAQRIMDGVVKAGLTDSIGSTSVMTYNDSGDVVTVNNINLATWDGASAMTQDKKYFTIQNVTNCQGLGDGVMTGIVNIFVKGTDRIRKYSHPIYRGLDLLSGFFVQLEGLHYVVKHTGTTASLAQSQELFYAQSWKEVPTSTSVYTNANSIVSATTEEGLTDNPVLVSTYTSAGSYPTGSDGWGKETDYNVSLFAHKVIGGAQHTYECGYIWYRGTSYSSPAGTNSSGYLTSNAKSANASVVGCSADVAAAGRSLVAVRSVADSYAYYAGGFAHPQIKVR